MEPGEKSEEQLKLEQVCSDIKQWRQTRGKLGAMPAQLWEDAASAARVLGVYPVSRALRVNYGVLKNRLAPIGRDESRRARRAKLSRKKTRNDFVEVGGLPLLRRASSEGTVVEMFASDRSRLVIRLQGGNPLDVAGLVTAFQAKRR